MIFRYAMRMWKRLLSACRSIQRAFLSRKSAMKMKLKQDRQVGMTASLNIAMGVKLRAAKAVAATSQRTVKAATILQTRMRSFLARRKVQRLLIPLRERIAETHRKFEAAQAQGAEPPPQAAPTKRDEFLELEKSADINIALVQKEGLEPFYWTVDRVQHKLGGQPDQTARRAALRAEAQEKKGQHGPKDLFGRPPKKRSRRRRRSLLKSHKHPSDPIDEYEYFDIYCGTRPAEEVQSYLELLQMGSDAGDIGGKIKAEIIHADRQHLDDTDVSESLFDMTIQGDMNYRIQNVESSSRPFASSHPLLSNTDHVLKNFSDVSVGLRRTEDMMEITDWNAGTMSDIGRRFSVDYAISGPLDLSLADTMPPASAALFSVAGESKTFSDLSDIADLDSSANRDSTLSGLDGSFDDKSGSLLGPLGMPAQRRPSAIKRTSRAVGVAAIPETGRLSADE